MNNSLLSALSFTLASVVMLSNISYASINTEELKKMKEASPAKATVKPKKSRKLLVFSLCKGYRHSSIPYCTKSLEIMGKKTGAFEIFHTEDMAIFEPENLKQFDAVCFNNTTQLAFEDENLRKSLLDFVRSGKGIVGIHAATDNFYKWPEAAELMGGVFDGHPWVAKGTWAVQIEDKTHPLTAAFKGRGFKINDEIYRTKPLNLRKNCRVLIGLDMTDKTNLNAEGVRPTDKDIPISWVRSYGKGRIFYCALGHNHHIFWNQTILQHYLDGIQFAFGDLPADSTPVPKANKK